MEATMLTQLFPRDHQRYSKSSVADWLEDFAKWLSEEGFNRSRSCGHVRRLKQALEQAGSAKRDSRFAAVELPTLFACSKSTQLPGLFRATQRKFEHFLRAQGQLVVSPEYGRFTSLLTEYRKYLAEQRGLVDTTVHYQMTTVSTFLSQSLPGDTTLDALPVSAVESFIASASNGRNRKTLQTVISHLRIFLAFCHDRGEIKDRLDIIDTPRTYRGEMPPRWPWVKPTCSDGCVAYEPFIMWSTENGNRYLACHHLRNSTFRTTSH
jgi:integrase/recombinase XerD